MTMWSTSTCIFVGALVMVVGDAEDGGRDDRPLMVNVKSGAGEPVAGADAFLVADEEGIRWSLLEQWVTGDEQGRISITPQYPPKLAQAFPKLVPYEGSAIVLVRAPRYAWQEERVEIPADAPIEITLDSGVPVQLRITSADDRAVPQTLQPRIATEPWRHAAWSGPGTTAVAAALQRVVMQEDRLNAFSLAVLERLDEDEFRFQIPPDRPSFRIMIDEPGFLRYYESELLTERDIQEGRFELKLSTPATLSVVVEPDEDSPAEYRACGVRLLRRSGPDEEQEWSFPLENRYRDSRRLSTDFEHLSPGAYAVEAFTGSREEARDMDRPDYFITGQNIVLGPGETAQLHFVLKTYDEEFYRRQLTGDHDLVITIRDSDGELAAGKPYEAFVQFLKFGHFNPMGTRLTLSKGEIPEDGKIHLNDLRSVPDATLILEVDGQYLGKIPISEAQRQELEYTLPPRVMPRRRVTS